VIVLRLHASDCRGFSLVELTVAAALLLLLVSSIVAYVGPADSAFAVQGELADMQQRLRAAADALRRDLGVAGGGVQGSQAGRTGPLTSWAPALLPLRIGSRDADPPGTFRPDAITILSVAPLPASSTSIGQPLPARNDVVSVEAAPGCPVADPVCGFAAGSNVVVADGEGAFDLFTVTGVTPPLLVLRHNGGDWAKTYPTGSMIGPVEARTYYLRAASGTRPPQLVRYGGGSSPDVPVVDHVVGLTFQYFGDPEPPRMRRPLSSASGPWTTYGPKPPPADTSIAPYPAGSNCVFQGNGSAIATPLLASLGTAHGALVPLAAAQLTDGPWCPNDAAPGRYDADLLRVRSVAVTIRVQSALDALRGPAGVLFARAGTARAGGRLAPDLEVRMRITPANLSLER
jgi:hypothetical protein